MTTPISLTYKRGTNVINLGLGDQIDIEERVWYVYLNGVKIAFISNDHDLATHYVYVSNEDHYICGSDTLADCKAVLTRIVSSIADGSVKECWCDDQQAAQDILASRIAQA